MRLSERLSLRFAVVALAVWVAVMDAASAQAAIREYRIAAQSLDQALREFALTSNLDLLFAPELVAGKRSPTLDGKFTIDEGLRTLLRGSGLEFSVSGSRVVINRAHPSTTGPATSPTSATSDTNGYTRLAQAEDRERATRKQQAEGSPQQRMDEVKELIAEKGIPEILVRGSRILNMDIRRDNDGTLPYVVFDHEKIQSSGANSVEEFLKQQLPMNTVAVANGQQNSNAGNVSQINLRGLGTGQTLILIDGRRTVTVNTNGSPTQADVNGIPLAAIERIEILPTTASGIYGGGATGGVINIILRRDYTGVETQLTYDNTFDSDSTIKRVDFNSGFTLEQGKTQVLLAGSYKTANDLLVRDRDLAQRGRAAVLANNPSFFLDSATPPLGATPNIRSSTGDNLTLKDGGTPLNSPITYVPVGYAGTAADRGAALIANAGQYNFDLADTAQSGGPGGKLGLANGPRVYSLMATVRRTFGAHVQGFFDAGMSDNLSHFATNQIFATFSLPASAPNNPFEQAITVQAPIAATDSVVESNYRTRHLLGGLIVELPRQWAAEVDYTWAESKLDYLFPSGISAAGRTAINSGVVDVLRDTQQFPVDLSTYFVAPQRVTPFRTTFKDATLRASGPVGSLPGGAPRLLALIEHRDELFGEATLIGAVQQLSPSRSQAVDSAYLEATIPLISKLNPLPGVQLLELQVAGRHDRYRLDGVTNFVNLAAPTPIVRVKSQLNSSNPTLGLRYQPTPALMLRASYSTGFLPPRVDQLVPTPTPTTTVTIVDGRRGNASYVAPSTLIGGNLDLRPEESQSWSAGLVLKPGSLPGLRLSVDYTRIEKKDNITTLTPQQIIDNEAALPGRVTRNPPAGDDPFGVGTIADIDRTLVNLAQARVEAYDVSLDYHVDAGRFGTLDFFSLATWQPHYQTQLIDTLPVIENAGVTSSFPLKLKGNMGVSWKSGAWTLNWTSRYFHSYIVSTNPAIVANQGSQRVPSQLYHDVFAAYRFQPKIGKGFEVKAGINNLFNTRPPFDASTSGNNLPYYYSFFGDPRLASYSISLSASF